MLFSDFGQSGGGVSRAGGSAPTPLREATLNVVKVSAETDDGNPPGAVFRFEGVDLLEVLRQAGGVIHNHRS